MGKNTVINLNVLYYSTLTPKYIHKHSAIQNNPITTLKSLLLTMKIKYLEMSPVSYISLSYKTGKSIRKPIHEFVDSVGNLHTVGP